MSEKAAPVTAVNRSEIGQNLGICVLIDVSGSMRGTKLAAAKEAVSRFLSVLSKSDKVALISFSTSPRIESDFALDRSKTRAALRAVAASNANTSLYDAVDLAERISWGAAPGRRIIIVLTDGKDNCSACHLEDLVRATEQRDVVIESIGVGGDADANVLKRLASVSGGYFAAARDPQGEASIYQNIARRIDTEYLVAFNAPSGVGVDSPFVVSWTMPDGRRLSTRGRLRESTTIAEMSPGARPAASVAVRPLRSPPVAGRSSLPYRAALIVAALVLAASILLIIRIRLADRTKAPIAENDRIADFPREAESDYRSRESMNRMDAGLRQVDHPKTAAGSVDQAEEPVRRTTIRTPDQAETLAWLVAMDGPMTGRQFLVNSSSATIGRGADADIRLTDDEQVSLMHALLSKNEAGGFVLVNMASTNGVWLNGNAVQQAELQDGDRFEIGQTVLVFKTAS